LSGSIASELISLSRTLIHNRGKSIKNASVAEVEETRDELLAVLTILFQAGYLREQAYGKHALGLGMVQYLAKEERPKQQAILISLWYKIRQNPQ
jgi:ribosomal protein S8